jgi:hypothetical protein
VGEDASGACETAVVFTIDVAVAAAAADGGVRRRRGLLEHAHAQVGALWQRSKSRES